jgi:hypothetical protein
MPDCWPEVSLHPEGPATGQLDQGFPWSSLALELILCWYPKSHVALHASHAALPMLDQNFTIMQPFQRAKSFTLSQTYRYRKDKWALPGNIQSRRKNVSPPPP